MRWGPAALAISLIALIAPTHASASFTTVVTSYGADTVNQALTVYEPTTPGPHPAILYVHGGCWARGTLTSAEVNLAQEIANKTGWVVATMTYRLTAPKWANMPADVDAALRTLQTGGYGVDPARVALWGESAGGQLSLLEGMKGTGGPGIGRPKAVVSISGPVDMRTELVSGGETALACVKDFEGGLPNSQAMVNRYWDTSSIGWIDKTDPTVFLGNGVADTLVPPTQPAQLAANLKIAGINATIALVPNDHHSTATEHDKVVGGSATMEDTAISWLRTTV
jgi:acetyl esterase/lipase